MPGLAGAGQLCIHGVGHSQYPMFFQRAAQRQETSITVAEQQAFGHAHSFRGARRYHACPSFLMMSCPAMTNMRSVAESTVPGMGDGSTWAIAADGNDVDTQALAQVELCQCLAVPLLRRLDFHHGIVRGQLYKIQYVASHEIMRHALAHVALGGRGPCPHPAW